MPELGTWAWLSWLAAIIAQLKVAWLVFPKRKQHRALFGYLCAKSLTSLNLLGITVFCSNEAVGDWLYFYIYYFGVMVSSAFGFAIISQIATSFVDSAEMREVVKVALRYMAGAFLVGSFLFSLLSPQPFHPEVFAANLAVICTRAFNLTSVVVFLGCLYAIRWLKMAWPAKVKGLAFGYALTVIGNMAFWLLGITDKQFLSIASDVLWLACLATWTITLRSAARQFPVERLCPASTLEV